MIHSAPAGVKAAARPDSAPAPRIPYAFRADPVALDELRIDPTARQVFTLVLDNAKDRGWKSRLSNATIGKILGRCPMTISRALGRLEAAGLVRRELIAGGRVRTGIAVTWEGVRREDLTGHPALRREGLTGSARALEGLGASAEQIRSPIQSERSDGGTSPSTGGKEAADYLRACVAAVKRGEPMPEPRLSNLGQTGAEKPEARSCNVAVAGEAAENAAAMMHVSPRYVSEAERIREAAPAVFVPSVARMVASLGERLKAEDVGRRRVGPAKLARQLAEMRKKHGRGVRG